MEPINFAGALWRSWRLLLVLAILGAAVAVVMPVPRVKQPKPVLHYVSYAVVGSVPRGGSNLLGGGVTGAQILFYAQSLGVLQDTARDAHYNIPLGQLNRYMVPSIGLPPNQNGSATTTTAAGKNKNGGNQVTLAAYGQTKTQAIGLANAWVYVLDAKLTAVATGRAASVSAAKAGTPAASKKTTSSTAATATTTPPVQTGFVVLEYAGTAKKAPIPSAGKLASRKIRLPLGFVLGALFGALIVFLRLLFDRRLRTASRAAALFGFPVIAEVPERARTNADQRAAPIDLVGQPNAPEAEVFRMLRMSVHFEALAASASTADPLAAIFGSGSGAFGSPAAATPALPTPEMGERKVVLVASPAEEETRPMVAANLAAVCAESGERVIIVGTAELRSGRPQAVPHGAKLSGDITPVDVESRLEPTRVPNISRLPLSMFLQHSSQLVNRGKELLDAARAVSDVVIVETPSLLSVHHAEALTHAVDVVIVVGECGATRLSETKKAGELLRRMHAPVLGMVLTNLRPPGVNRRRPPPAALPTTAAPILSAVEVVASPAEAETSTNGSAPEPATVYSASTNGRRTNGRRAHARGWRPWRRRSGSQGSTARTQV